MSFLKSVPFENKIIIYWGYEHYSKDLKHEFYINGKKIGKTTKNYFTYDNLIPNTKYLIEVKEGDKLFDSIEIKTLPEREKLVISICSEKVITKEIQEVLNKAENKTVVFKKGKYVTGALFVKPNTFIELEKGAIIQGSSNSADYLPMIPSRFEGLTMNCYASLINIGNCNPNGNFEDANIYIYGKGEIIGGGHQLCENIINDMLPTIDATGLDLNKTNPRLLAGRFRGRLIQVNNSKNIVIEGLKLGYSASWNLHLIYSKDIVITNCYFESKNLHNGDGIDPDSSENVTIFNNYFDTGDDCVAIKSGKNPDGNKINRPAKNISVFDCKSKTGHGCCIGSEMSGGVEDIYFFDCDFENTRYGVQIKTTKKRGGYVKNVFVKDLKLSAINVRTVTYNDDGLEGPELPIFHNLNFENISLTGIDIGNYGNEEILINHIEIKGFEDNPESFNCININNINYKNSKKRILVENATNVFLEGEKL